MTSVKTRYNTIIRVIQTVQLEPRLAARVVKCICIESNRVSNNILNLVSELVSLSNSYTRCR